MHLLIIVMSFVLISCGKNTSNFLPIPNAPVAATVQEVSHEPTFKAQMSFVATNGGVVKTGNIELTAIALDDVASLREGKEVDFATSANAFALYAPDLSKRLELLEKLGTADLGQAQIVIKINRELTGRWGWVDSRGALTWNDKIEKRKDESFVITINDKHMLAAILEHRSLPTIKFENYNAKMASDDFVAFKVHNIKASHSREFDFTSVIEKDSIIKAEAYAVTYTISKYNKSLRYKHCEWFDNGDVGGRHNKALVCSERSCEVVMNRVVESSRQKRALKEVMSFDQETKVQDNWFYAYRGDSFRMKSDFESEIVNVGMVGQGTCAGKEMLDSFPGTSSMNIAPRNIVKLTDYLVL